MDPQAPIMCQEWELWISKYKLKDLTCISITSCTLNYVMHIEMEWTSSVRFDM